MKQIYAIVAFTFFSFSMFAQLPVSQEASNKVVVLEEFTGITCVFCPDGHKIANELAEANPGKFLPINIHTGGFASPQGPGTDFRTADGNTIANQAGMGITGYPQGALSRTVFSGTAMAHSRGDWAANAATMLAQPSYVNVAGEATLDVETREMTINIEAYYTMEGAPETNKYTVALLQDNISGPQTGAADFYPEQINDDGTYTHNHMLRDIINPTVLGDEVATTTMGTTFAETINYTVPANYTGVSAELADLHLIVFIAETNTDIVTAAVIPIEYVGFTTTNNAAVEDVKELPETCKNVISPSFRLRNKGAEDLTSAVITYAVNGGTAESMDWSGSISPLGSEVVELPEIAYTLAETNTLNITVTDVNGGADEDDSNNIGSIEFVETSAAGASVNLTFELVTDAYGSETTWSIFDETGSTVASGGPYNDLTAAGTTTHIEDVTVPSKGCYSAIINDSYGDGMNAGFGAGGAELRDGYGDVIWSMNGEFSSSIAQDYNITSDITVGIVELVEEGFSVYPNPASDNMTIEFDAQNGSYDLNIVDMTGRVIYSNNLDRVNGKQFVTIPVNEFAAGVYIVDIVKEGKKFTQRVIVQ